MLFLSRQDTRDLLTLDQAATILQAALREYSDETVVVPDARRLSLTVPAPDQRGSGAYCFAKLCHLRSAGIIGFRLVASGSDPARATRLILLCEAQHGAPLAMMAEHALCQMRVGALAAVTIRYLATPNPAPTVGLVGAGPLARAILAAIREVRRPARVLVASRRAESRQAFVTAMSIGGGGAMSAVDDVREAVMPADIVVTATTSREPIVRPEWIKPGALLYLVGAGCEAGVAVYRRATKFVVSDWKECLAREDVAGMVERGELREGDVYANLHEIVQGAKAGRTDDREIILVRAPGSVFHDVALAHQVYVRAVQAGRGIRVDG